MGDPLAEVWTTRGFQAECFSFSVTTNEEHLCRAVEMLFSDLAKSDAPAAEFIITENAQETRLEGPEPLPTSGGRDSDAILTDLVTAVNRQMLDAGSDRLHLHAGAVAKEGSAVVISAPSGQGKTTLVTALALRGWDYLTDEAVSIAAGDRTVRSFPKPISVKPGGHLLFPELGDFRVSTAPSDPTIWHVPLGRLSVTTATEAEPTLVVILSRHGDYEMPSWEPASPADAVVHLVEQSLDLERYGEDALVALAELCARCRCVRIEAGSPTATAIMVEELAADEAMLDLTVRVLDVSPEAYVNQDVVSVAIGAEAVFRHAGTGQVVSLNPAATQIWEDLCSARVEISALRAEDAGFVRQLIGMGCVRPPPGMVTADGA